jgi:hypothetical protein
LRGRVEDEPEVTSSLRGCNPTLLLLLLYGLMLLLIMLATGSTPGWQPVIDVVAIAVIGGAFVLNLMGVWFGRIALGTLAATLDVWGRRQVPLMVMRVNVGDAGPVPVMMATVDHGFRHGDEVVIKGYMTLRGMRASRIRNDTTGQRVWDTQPLGNVIVLLMLLALFAMDLAGHLS